jgi:hypothetical protein
VVNFVLWESGGLRCDHVFRIGDDIDAPVVEVEIILVCRSDQEGDMLK